MSNEYIGVGELVAAIQAEMSAASDPKTRGNAAEVPTERTIRYYLQEGLIPPPLGKQGVNLRFGRIHLLAVRAIKRLQEYGMVNNAGIRELIAGRGEADLEALLQEEVKTVTDPAEIRRYRSMSSAELEAEFGEPVIKADMTKQTNPATEFFQEKLFGRGRESPPITQAPAASAQSTDLPSMAPPPAPGSRARSLFNRLAPEAPPKAESWSRSEIADGIELHIRGDVTLPVVSSERRSIMKRLKRLLGI